MDKKSTRNCPVCGFSTCSVLTSQSFALFKGHPLSNGYDICCCSKCGFIFADTEVSQSDLDNFYESNSKYESAITSTGSGKTIWDQKRLNETASQIVKIVKNKSAHILDIGCADGGLLAALKKFGFTKLTGFDPSPICVSHTIENTGANAFVGSIFSENLLHQQFDLIVLSHVMEHILDLRGAIQRIASLLQSDGKLYIEVPDANRYLNFNFSPFQEFNTEHINHFSIQTLKTLFSLNGFSIFRPTHRKIMTGPDQYYPVINAFFSKNQFESRIIHKDRRLMKNIDLYIRDSRNLLDDIDRKINQINQSHPQIIVWGTGQLTLKLLCETSLRKANIRYFVDGNSINQGKTLNGVIIKSPNEIDRSDIPILIASILQKESIIQSVQQYGIKNSLLLL